VPSFASHFRSSLATNFGRTNVLRDSPEQHHVRQRFDHFVPPQPSGHADRQTLPRKFIDHRQHALRSSVVRFRADKIIAPHVIRAFRPQPHARSVVQPQPPARPLFCWHFQPFLPPDALHAVLAHLPACFSQFHRDASVAVAPVFACQFDDRSRQRVLVGSINHLAALRSSPLPQHPAGVALADSILLARMFHGAPASRGA
jgi:hypothetical protein